jgi:hypothetical protein
MFSNPNRAARNVCRAQSRIGRPFSALDLNRSEHFHRARPAPIAMAKAGRTTYLFGRQLP